MALIDYARVSTAEQDTTLQADALNKVGCERIFEDTVSGLGSKLGLFASFEPKLCAKPFLFRPK